MPVSPIQESRKGPVLSRAGQTESWTGPFQILVACLLVAAVSMSWFWWKADQEKSHDLARLAARGSGAALEARLSEAFNAVESLSSLARQSGGDIPNFQTFAQQLLTSSPNVTTLELQPAGVIKDLVPRVGNERAIGLNAFKHPALSADAEQSFMRRATMVTGPVPLYHGEPGLIIRSPIFFRGRDGRETMWGFVAATMRLPSKIEELSQAKYEYSLVGIPHPGQPGSLVAGQNSKFSPNAVREAIPAGNVQFILSVQPRAELMLKVRAVFEALLSVLTAAALFWLVNVRSKWSAARLSLADTSLRLAGETAAREKAEADERTASAQATTALNQGRLGAANLQRTEAALAEAKTRLETLATEARNAELAARTKQEEMDSQVRALQKQLEAETKLRKKLETQAAEAQARLELAETEARTAQQGANSRLEEFERDSMAQLNKLTGEKQLAEELAEKVGAESRRLSESLAAAQKEADELKLNLGKVEQASAEQAAAAASALAALQQEYQASNTNLQTRLSNATRKAREASEASAASLQEAEEQIRSLRERLALTEQSESRLAGLNSDNRNQPTAELAHTPFTEAPDMPSPEPLEPAKPPEVAQATEPTAWEPEASVEPEPEPNPAVPAAAAPNLELASEPKPEPEGAPTEASDPEPSTEVQASIEPPAPVPSVEESAAPPFRPVAEPNHQEPVTPTSPNEITLPPEAQPTTTPPSTIPAPDPDPVPAPPSKPARTRRKTEPSTPQMDLFGAAKPETVKPAEIAEPQIELFEQPLAKSEIVSTAEASIEPASQSTPAPDTHSDPPWDPAPASTELFASEAAAKDTSQTQSLEKIRSLLEEGDWVNAHKLSQKIKSEVRELNSGSVNSAAAALVKAIHDQADPAEIETIWQGLSAALKDPAETSEGVTEDKAAGAKLNRARAPAPHPAHPGLIKKAASQILPLLADADPGAQDCFADHRETFQTAFTPEAFEEFAGAIQTGQFAHALEQLKKVTRKLGISI